MNQGAAYKNKKYNNNEIPELTRDVDNTIPETNPKKTIKFQIHITTTTIIFQNQIQKMKSIKQVKQREPWMLD